MKKLVRKIKKLYNKNPISYLSLAVIALSLSVGLSIPTFQDPQIAIVNPDSCTSIRSQTSCTAVPGCKWTEPKIVTKKCGFVNGKCPDECDYDKGTTEDCSNLESGKKWETACNNTTGCEAIKKRICKTVQKKVECSFNNGKCPMGCSYTKAEPFSESCDCGSRLSSKELCEFEQGCNWSYIPTKPATCTGARTEGVEECKLEDVCSGHYVQSKSCTGDDYIIKTSQGKCIGTPRQEKEPIEDQSSGKQCDPHDPNACPGTQICQYSGTGAGTGDHHCVEASDCNPDDPETCYINQECVYQGIEEEGEPEYICQNITRIETTCDPGHTTGPESCLETQACVPQRNNPRVFTCQNLTGNGSGNPCDLNNLIISSSKRDDALSSPPYAGVSHVSNGEKLQFNSHETLCEKIGILATGYLNISATCNNGRWDYEQKYLNDDTCPQETTGKGKDCEFSFTREDGVETDTMQHQDATKMDECEQIDTKTTGWKIITAQCNDGNIEYHHEYNLEDCPQEINCNDVNSNHPYYEDMECEPIKKTSENKGFIAKLLEQTKKITAFFGRVLFPSTDATPKDQI